MVDESFIRIADAAAYVGVSPQTLRRWDRDGTLRAMRQPNSGYRYYTRAELEPFRLQYRRAEEAAAAGADSIIFVTANADIESNVALRDPQREAHRAVREHFATNHRPAIIQIPVGCGKTGIMATLPFGIARGRVLMITPNLTIRKSVATAVDITSPQCFWTKCRVLSDFTAGPWMAVLDGPNANIHDAIESHFVVCNIQQLASQADRWLPQFPEDFFDMILVDEGHHAAAESWQKVFRRFPNAKIVSLTATPFRSDQQELHGEIVYRYPFTRAMINGYIKQIHSRNVAPSEIYFTYQDDNTRRHTLEEVLELREEAWFRRGVALSPECNRHIVEASIQQCERMRAQTGIQHQIIAAACSVDHARQIASIYRECNYRAAEIHSDMAPDDQDAVIERLRQGQLDCIVQVQMLGEGFDHPRLSVAAVFRPFRSLAPYIQFVGRVMRVVQDSAPDHPDNQGHIISHVGLNNDACWTEFRELDLDDQALVHAWVAGQTDDCETDGGETPQARRFDTGMLVDNEILTDFVEHAYLDPTDDRVLDELLDREVAAGVKIGDLVDREQLRERLLARQAADHAPAPQSIPVSPQRERQSSKNRVNERTKSVANRILAELGFHHHGHELMTVVRGRRQHNSAIVIRQLNTAINEATGMANGTRGEWSREQLQIIFDRIDDLGDSVRDALKIQLNQRN